MLYGTLLRTTKAAVAVENTAHLEFSFNMKKTKKQNPQQQTTSERGKIYIIKNQFMAISAMPK
jgi:hypothetical protein